MEKTNKDFAQILVQVLTSGILGEMVLTGPESITRATLAAYSRALVYQHPLLHRCLLCH